MSKSDFSGKEIENETQIQLNNKLIQDIFNDEKLIPNSYSGAKTYGTRDLLAKEFKKLGYKTDYIGNKYLMVHIGNERVIFYETESTKTSLLGYRILKNKNLARKFLKAAGISIAVGKYFGRGEKKKAAAYASSLSACVIKPSDGHKGNGVSVGVKNEQEFHNAWNTAIKNTQGGVLVEEQFIGGIEARYLVVHGRCVAVLQRIPPSVVGNGNDTIETLIKKKNEERKKNPHLRNRLIKINSHRLTILKGQGFNLLSIPPNGVRVLIDWKAGFSTGADSYDITDKVHPSFKKLAERAATNIPGLDTVGIDIIAHNHMKEPTSDNYIVVEANTRPGILGHHFPVVGKPRNVARNIAEYTVQKVLDSK
ncbi:hypothetical protein ACIQ34_08385 [Ureibacillus sp. NPDC094379]